ncbi:MAG: hypothetical protein J0L67_15345 [Cytophagales bacterium]|nr:hypothetical protein [Cytophagales bacterium]
MKVSEYEGVIKKCYKDEKLIDELVAQKIDFISGQKIEFLLAEKWKEIIDQLRNHNLKVEDMSYLQFPNLKLVVDEDTMFDYIKERRSLIIVLSLLCPVYTYYYKYSLLAQAGVGFIKIGEVNYLKNNILQKFIPNMHGIDVKKLIESTFLDYRYESHYFLTINRFDFVAPYKSADQSKNSTGYSFFEFLFESYPLDGLWD